MEEIMVKLSQRNRFNVRHHEPYLTPVLKALALLLVGRHGVFIGVERENAYQRWKVPPAVADFILLAGYSPKTSDYQNSLKECVVGTELALTPYLEQELAALKGNLDKYAALCSGAGEVLIPFPNGAITVRRDFSFRQQTPIDVLTCYTGHVKLHLLTSIFDENSFLKLANTPLGFIKDALYCNLYHPSCFDIDGIRYCPGIVDKTPMYYMDGAVIKYGKTAARDFDIDVVNGLLRAIEDNLPLAATLALQSRGD
ncbi:MAG: hypothetical protein JRN66_06960 [Nitrososphaerota archaeon]|nr:hypothetical protein [Nitrososphaerota archaeon]